MLSIGKEVRMATIITESKWPNESNKKITELWLGMDELPEYLKIAWVGTTGDINMGNRALVLWNCDDAKLAEALFFVKKEAMRYNVVPGYSYTVKVWAEPEEGLKMLGMD
jgi:hypothetical protein